MGFGAGLALIAIGAILAFATRFSLSGINVQMIGWILMVVGVVGMLVTFKYIRPRHRGQVAEVIEDEPAAYVTHPEEAAPYVYTRTDADETGPVPERYLDDHPR
jgi:Na+/melibiose symporter-like transporter